MSRPPAALVLLIFEVPRRDRARFLRFIQRAFRLYEAPGGIHMTLFEDVAAPGRFTEIASYDSMAAFRADQVRVGREPRVVATLAEWRRYLTGAPQVLLVRRVVTRRR